MSTAQPPPNYPPQAQPARPESPFPPIRQKKPWFKRWWAIVLFIVVGLLALSALINPGGETAPTTAVPGPTITVTETVEVGPDETAPTKEPEPEPDPTTKAAPEPDGLGEGTYQVGTDAKPGRYKTTVPGDSSNCYWERAKDDSGELDSIIANANASAGAKVSVTLKKGEFFTSNGCGTWVRQ